MDIMTCNTPKDWGAFRLGQVFRERKEKGSDKDFPPLSVTMKGIVPQLESAAKTDDGDNRKIVRVGDYVINSRSDRRGSGGISEYEGSVSLISIVLEPIGIAPRFAHFLLRSSAFQEEFYRWGHGIVADLWTTRYTEMKNVRLAIPDLNSQHQIAEFLDRETTRIDSLIEKKEKMTIALAERIEGLVAQAISDPSTPRIRFENAALRVLRAANLSEHQELIRLGLYNRGRGIFKKPAADEEGMGASDFFFVKAGDLILSGQFAWEGAVALASGEEEGCVVSHRYPIYVGRPGISTAYLLGLLRSNFGAFLLNEASRGSAGRNRPLNTWRLGKEKIPAPSPTLQRDVEKAIFHERQLTKRIATSIDRLAEYRSALITAAVTGQIDVQAYHKRGETDRTLDRIEAEMSS